MPPDSSLNFSDSFPELGSSCLRSGLGVGVFSSFLVSCGVLLPVSFLVLLLGYQRARRPRSTFNPDLFLFHAVAMHLGELFGLTLVFCGGYNRVAAMLEGGVCVWLVTSVGQSQLHLLTCVELHLAVVRPVAYLRLRRPWARLRSAVVVAVWLLSIGWLVLLYRTSQWFHSIVCVCVFAIFLAVTSCCSVFILCTLRHHGPGGVAGRRRQVSRSKRRAFRTIVVIMAALLLRYTAGLLGSLMLWAEPLGSGDLCPALLLAFWVELPSALVLPLRFLHREGKLQRKRKIPEGAHL